MPVTYNWVSAEIVLSTAESLKKVAEQLTQVAYEMQQHGMKKALFPWTPRQDQCHDLIVKLANQCVTDLPAQTLAKSQNRPSIYEQMQQKSKRDVAARKTRSSAGSPAASKTRGRPKKK